MSKKKRRERMQLRPRGEKTPSDPPNLDQYLVHPNLIHQKYIQCHDDAPTAAAGGEGKGVSHSLEGCAPYRFGGGRSG